MDKHRRVDPVLFPLLAVLTVAAYAGGLGVIFMVLEHYIQEAAVIALGVALVIGVPTAASLLERRLERE